MPPQPPSAASRDEPVIRDRGDACPGALRLHAADDGYLARVRIPGGLLTVPQAAALGLAADRFGDGHLELTSRGNVQLRGLADGCGGGLAELLGGVGLLPAPSHERVRNIVASPMGGAHVVRWVRELDRLLCASSRAADLSGRFLFALDDGRGDVAALEPDVTVLAHSSTGPGSGPGAGPDGEPRPRPGAETSAGPATGTAAGPATGTAAGPGGGTSAGLGAGTSAGSDSGTSAGPGAGTSAGPGAGTAAGPATGAAAGPGAGTSAGLGAGASTRPGVVAPAGPGAATSAGPGSDHASGFGFRPGARPGPGAGAGGADGSGRVLVRLGAGVGAVEVGGGDAARTALAAAEYFLDVADDAGTRAWRVAELPVGHRLDERELVLRLRGAGIEAVAVPEVEWPYAEPPRPWGAYGDGLCVLPPLGRLSSAQWRVLAEAADDGDGDGDGELRVTPWRTVILPRAGAEGPARIEAAGLVLAPASPWQSVTACTGKPGCAKSLADVRADARAVVEQTAGGLPVHWSGCARRCGHPRGTAWVDLVATPDGYALDARPVPHADLAAALTAARSTTPTTTTEAAVKK
ncbi:nitrite reductase [Streptomyces sp. NPDC006687]|uniref:nitrite reductase n=1 Tax=unclassified Streptomyces TaxID=2593676 RepID=UPI0033C9A9AD